MPAAPASRALRKLAKAALIPRVADAICKAGGLFHQEGPWRIKQRMGTKCTI
jgi:hypothetical protein